MAVAGKVEKDGLGLALATAIMRAFLALPCRALPMKGKAMPAKFDPPPAQPITMSGQASAAASCSIASCPMTV